MLTYTQVLKGKGSEDRLQKDHNKEQQLFVHLAYTLSLSPFLSLPLSLSLSLIFTSSQSEIE